MPHKARGSLACHRLCQGLASLFCVPGVRCCDVQACSRLCVRDSHRWVCCPVRACLCVGEFNVRPTVRCVRLVCVGAGCSAVRVRVPWFVQCMIPAWVYALPVVVCVARHVGLCHQEAARRRVREAEAALRAAEVCMVLVQLALVASGRLRWPAGDVFPKPAFAHP
jgi:hypothetical protein